MYDATEVRLSCAVAPTILSNEVIDSLIHGFLHMPAKPIEKYSTTSQPLSLPLLSLNFKPTISLPKQKLNISLEIVTCAESRDRVQGAEGWDYCTLWDCMANLHQVSGLRTQPQACSRWYLVGKTAPLDQCMLLPTTRPYSSVSRPLHVPPHRGAILISHC